MAKLKPPLALPEDVDHADYDRGFEAQLLGASFDFDKPLAWRLGWLEADTHEIASRMRRDDMKMDEHDRRDMADRDAGFEARLDNVPLNPKENAAWQQGWMEAERSLIEERYDRERRKKA
jgi:hypothetical protein